MPTAFIPPDYFARYDVAQIFGCAATECEVDLGCGDGGFLLAMARHYPGRLFLGIERLLGRVRKVCARADREDLPNIRCLRAEIRYFLEWMIQPGSIRRLHYLFPDPWPKERHRKKRLIQADFLPVLHRALTAGGEVLFRTDYADYFEWVNACFAQSPLFAVLSWDHASYYPETDFQRRWESQGKSTYSARFVSLTCAS